MDIVDAQIHEIGPFWDWTGEPGGTQHRVLGEVLVAYLNAVGVSGAVLFPGGDPTDAAWIAAQIPDRFAYVQQINADPEDADAFIAAAKARHAQGQLAVRVLLGWPMDGAQIRRFEQGAWDAIFAACEKHGVPVFLFITGWLPRAAEIATRWPKLTLIVDHLGLRQPPLDTVEDPPFKLLHELIALAAHPNIHIKLCGMPSMSLEDYPYRDVEPHLRAIVDAFGADRLMWGSDTSRFVGSIGIGRFQNPRSAGPYQGKHCYAEALHFIRESSVLSQAEKEAILGGTLRRVLNWPA